MRKLPFTKMNGAGNDFVVLDNRGGQTVLDAPAVARLCDRHRGVGADGVLVVESPAPGPSADFRMRYYNADGGEAEMCGNGARCFARYAARLGDGSLEAVSFQTMAGVIRARLEGEQVRLDMSVPTDGALLGALALEGGHTFSEAYFLNTGVPHVVVPVEDVDSVDVHPLGQSIRHHDRFAPRGTNANFIERVSPESIILRTYERGVEDETLACGTGATASALIHAELNGINGAGTVAVRVRSGDTLYVGFTRVGPLTFEHVTLAGPADFVFGGEISI